jgi:hypothetical protein
MPALVAGIHDLDFHINEYVDGRDIGERSDAALRAAMPAMTLFSERTRGDGKRIVDRDSPR